MPRLTQIAGTTQPIFLIVAVGFIYSRAVKPDLAGANKLVVAIKLPALIFTSLSSKSFNPQAALLFTAAAAALMLFGCLPSAVFNYLLADCWRTATRCSPRKWCRS